MKNTRYGQPPLLANPPIPNGFELLEVGIQTYDRKPKTPERMEREKSDFLKNLDFLKISPIKEIGVTSSGKLPEV